MVTSSTTNTTTTVSKRQRLQNDFFFSCDQDEDRNNTKKMKIFLSVDRDNFQNENQESFNDSITCLNQYGFDAVLIGNSEKAEHHFLDAIALLPQLEIKIPETCKSKTGLPLFMMNAIVDDSSINFYPENDEGIHPDSVHPIRIEKSYDDSMKASILMYNIGLTYNRRRDFTTSLKWFDTSLDYLASSQTERNNLIFSVQILHAIGLCNYRINKHCESIICYKNALNQIKEIKDYDNKDLKSELLAYTNNALAVVILRSTKSNTDDTNIASELLKESLRLYENLDRCDMLQSIASVFSNTGRANYKNGQYEQAAAAYEASLKIRQHIKNQCHWIDIGFVMHQLGKTYQLLRQTDDAAKQFQDFLDLSEIQSKYDSEQQKEIAAAATQLASIQIQSGNCTSALRSFERALEATQSVYGMITIEVAAIVNKMGSVCYKLGRLEESLKYLTKGLQIEKVVYGVWHDNVVVTLLNLAQIYRDQDDYTKAFLHYKQVHTIQVKKSGHYALPVSHTLYSMGLMMYRMKSYAVSFEHYQKALFIQRKHIGDDVDHEDIAASLNSIGIVLFHWGKIQIAKSFFEESLSMRRKLYGSYHRYVSVNLFNLATLYLELGDDDLATTLYEESLKVERKIQSQPGSDILQTLHRLGSLYHSRGELDEALSYFEEALDLERVRYGNDHIFVGKTLNFIGNIYLQRGLVDQMMNSFTEAARICSMSNDSLVIAGFILYGISKLHPECAEAA